MEKAVTTGAVATTGPCLQQVIERCNGALRFIPNRTSGFWLNPEASHQLAYVTQKGNWQQFGVLTLRRQSRGNDAEITATLPSTNP